jgi:hypothetical protein
MYIAFYKASGLHEMILPYKFDYLFSTPCNLTDLSAQSMADANS